MKTRVVWKYPLEVTDLQTLWPPRGAQVLAVQAQGGVPTLWLLVDPEAKPEALPIYIVGTGNPVDLPSNVMFRGTVQTHGGALVWHVFTGPRDSDWER